MGFSWVHAEGNEAGAKAQRPLLLEVRKAGAEDAQRAAMGPGTGGQGCSPVVPRWVPHQHIPQAGAGVRRLFDGGAGRGVLCIEFLHISKMMEHAALPL